MKDRRRKWDKQQDELGIIKVCVRVPRENSGDIKADAAEYRRKRNKGDNQ